jgi:tetratricopeptide (TPR) repeat protein
VKILVVSVLAFMMVASGLPIAGQTFEIKKPADADSAKQKKRAVSSDAVRDARGDIGWGSSIEVARQARAAEDALKRGNYAAAVAFAERAARAAPQNTQLWFLLGYAARLAGRYGTSVEAFRRGLQNEPGSLQGLSGLAQTYARMGRTGEAKKLLTQVIAANPRSPNDLLLAGDLFLQTGEPRQALELLHRAETMQPGVRSELLLAVAYRRLNQPEKSRQYLEAARSKAPQSRDVLRAVAAQYRESGKYDAAIAALQAVPGRNPEILAELGFTYQLAGMRKQAAEAYSQAATAAPKEIGMQLAAAQAMVATGDLKKAESFLKRATAINPGHYRLHAIRAQIAQRENRNAEAIQEFRLALAAMPESVPEGVLFPIEIRSTLAESYRQEDEPAAAEEQIHLAAQAIQPLDIQGEDRPEFLRLRASIEVATGKLQAAEADLKEALSLDPDNANITLNYANVLSKVQQKQVALQMYQKALEAEPNNRPALTAIAYLLREMGDAKSAEMYFQRLATADPNDYVPFLGLGDLYTSLGQFDRALTNYEKAFQRNPKHALTVSGATNAALEARKFDVAKAWLDQADSRMNQNPEVMRERQRYLTFMGRYLEAARLGYEVLKRLPADREAPVYLAYDLLYLGRYDDAFELASRYEKILPKDKDLPLVQGYVHTHRGLLDLAVDDFTDALSKEPNMATGYVNRGYVLNDLQNPRAAAEDFRNAIRLNPKYGEAHLGLAYANLQLHHPKEAVDHLEVAERLLGESKATHLARAGAYRQQHKLELAKEHYEAALRHDPQDLEITAALADTLYGMRRYNDAIRVLEKALALWPDDPQIYAGMAHAYAKMGQRAETFHAIELAERLGSDQGSVLLATGGALLTLGDDEAAMERFERALLAPDASKVDIRLAIARGFARRGHWDDARQQISLAFTEARIGEAPPATSDNFMEAAALLLGMNDFELATKFFERAKAAGADEHVIAIGMANAYLAQGQTLNAEAELASLGNPSDYAQNYDYMMAKANVYRQQRDTRRALSALARASELSSDDETAQREIYEVAAEEGRPLNDKFSLMSETLVGPIFEDINIYTLDATLRGITSPQLLPGPRSSFETRQDMRYRVHLNGWPPITGFLQLRNARGTSFFPSEGVIQDRNTYDTTLNGALNPVLRLGSAALQLTGGLQFTIRRDTISARDMNQNLFRQFLYFSTTPLFNWVTIRGSGIHESGPFTMRDLRSRDLAASLSFTVGRPWGRTALVTGYSVRDIQFDPLIREYFTTSSYAGIERKIGQKVKLAAVGEYLRSWRVENLRFALAQAMRPAVRFEYRPNLRWSVEGSFALSRGQGFHQYDNFQTGFLVSYVKPVGRTVSDGGADVSVPYPLRFSFGFQQQTFYHLGGSGTKLAPVFRLTLF